MDNSIPITVLMLLTTILVPIVGIMLALTPYLMKKSECFAVTVPESALHDPYLRALKKRYALLVLLATAVLTALGLGFTYGANERAVIVLVSVGMLLLVAGSYGLMLYFRGKVRLYKKEQNWKAVQQESVAVVGSGEVPRAIALAWNLLYLPVMLLTLAIGSAGYASMPDLVPTNMGIGGDILYTAKTPMVVWTPVLIQLFIAFSLLFSHWMITRSKRTANPSAPATSTLAYGMFARAQSIFLLATGMIINLLMIAMPLSFMGVVTLMQAAVLIMIGALVIVVGAIALAIVYGQGGSRVFARMQASENLPADDDRYWKLGVFYYNPDDPSLFLLERFGIGWTVNFARPAVWAIIGAFLVVTVAFVAVMLVAV